MSALDDLAAIVKQETGSNNGQARDAVKAVLGYIQTKVKAGEEVTLVGFGTFKQVELAARTGRNPSTGETLDIPARKAAKFKASKIISKL